MPSQKEVLLRGDGAAPFAIIDVDINDMAGGFVKPTSSVDGSKMVNEVNTSQKVVATLQVLR